MHGNSLAVSRPVNYTCWMNRYVDALNAACMHSCSGVRLRPLLPRLFVLLLGGRLAFDIVIACVVLCFVKSSFFGAKGSTIDSTSSNLIKQITVLSPVCFAHADMCAYLCALTSGLF